MVNMIREKEENKQKILLTTIIGVISTITFVTLLIYLKCPHCKTRTWCRKVMTKE